MMNLMLSVVSKARAAKTKEILSQNDQFTSGEQVWIGTYLFSEFRRSAADDRVVAGKNEIWCGFNMSEDKIPDDIRADFLEILRMLEYTWDSRKKAWHLKLK